MLADKSTFTSVVLRVADLDRSAKWYQSVLGVEVSTGTDGDHPFAAFTLGGTVVSLWQLADDEEPPRGSVSDPYVVTVVAGGIEEVRADLARREVAVTDLFDSKLHRLFRFRDPDGNVIEVTQLRDA